MGGVISVLRIFSKRSFGSFFAMNPPRRKTTVSETDPESRLELVQVDGVALMKIMKHCKEESAGLQSAQGVLLGLQVENRGEVTNCNPLPYSLNENDEDFQKDNLRKLRKVNIDHSPVGFYQASTPAAFVSLQLIESYYGYNARIEDSIFILFDPEKTARGYLGLRAFRMTPSALKFFSENEFTPENQKGLKLSFETILQEIRIVIKNSMLTNALMMELEGMMEEENLYNDALLDLGTTSVLEKQVRHLLDTVDSLGQEVFKYNTYQRHVVRQAQSKIQHVQRRAAENELRKARGEDPLPEEDLNKMFKPIAAPSRREPLVTAAQVTQYSSQIANFAAQAMAKLFVSETIQNTRAEAES